MWIQLLKESKLFQKIIMVTVKNVTYFNEEILVQNSILAIHFLFYVHL